MNIHQQFHSALASLQDGEKIQDAYRRYKTADDGCAFELNGRLKSGLPLGDDLMELHLNLRRAICGGNKSEITLYRMTSDFEFIGPLLPVMNGKPFQYQAYLSASGSRDRLQKFTPSKGTPLLLEIRCLPGTRMALMEAVAGTEEDEYLLGCGTLFAVERPPEDNELQLRVERNPAYATASHFEF
jgi:hypothetical protein